MQDAFGVERGLVHKAISAAGARVIEAYSPTMNALARRNGIRVGTRMRKLKRVTQPSEQSVRRGHQAAWSARNSMDLRSGRKGSL